VEGRTHPVEVEYLSEPCKDYVEAAVKTVIDIHEHERDGDVLVFLTGQEEIEAAVDAIREAARHLKNRTPQSLHVHPLYAALPADRQLAAFAPPPRSVRKVVVSTNLCEASVTIDGIVFVVDPCYVKAKAADANSGVSYLVVAPTSQASATQRAGRAGRTQPGKCYRLLREADFSRLLPRQTVPEIMRTDLTSALLYLKCLGIDNLVSFEFVSPPSLAAYTRALESLYALGALDDKGKLVVPLGVRMAELPLTPEVNRMLLLSTEEGYGCAEEALIMAAMTSVKSPWIATRKKDYLELCKLSLGVAEGDLLTYFNMYQQYFFHTSEESDDTGWAGRHMVHGPTILRARDIRNQLEKHLRRYKLPISSGGQDTPRIARLVAASLFINAAQNQGNGKYVLCRSPLSSPVMSIHPSSVLVSAQPPWVVFQEAVFSGDTPYMQGVTAIDPRWLSAVAPHYFHMNLQRDGR